MKNINRIVLFASCTLLLIKPLTSSAQYVYQNESVQKCLDEARQHVYNEQFKEAVKKYTLLVKENDNKTVSAEYAYALALSECYEGAIMNLDKIFASGQVDKDVLFFTAQVLQLMAYDSVADLFWTFSYDKQYIAPGWISGQYQSFAKKYKRLASINTDDLGTALQRANKLADHKQYIQSMVLFLELIDTYPEQYLPCVGLSALFENLGLKKAAIAYLQKGIERVGGKKNLCKIDPFGAYEKHLNELIASNTKDNLSVQTENKTQSSNGKTKKGFTHYGLTYANKTLTLNAKYGVYWSNNSYISFGFGYSYYEDNTTYLADVSLCYSNIIVVGIDVSARRTHGSYSFGIGPCAGLSIPIGRTSIDLLSVLNMTQWQDNLMATLNTSAGITFYF